MSKDLTAIVLTLNEEQNLPECLNSLRSLDCEVFVVDSGSTDRTTEVAIAGGAQVVCHEFENQAQQLNWALENLPVKGRWVLRLDADERLTPELAHELYSKLPTYCMDITGLYVKRRVLFMGRWIRHGGYYPTWLLRVWRCGSAEAEDRLMDEHMILLNGKAAFLDNDILEDNKKGLYHWVERHNRYAIREVQALLTGPTGREISPSFFGNPVARRRWLRRRVYDRLPLFIRPALYFAYRYIMRLGFLDGLRGLAFHFLQSFWYRFLVDTYILESKLRGRNPTKTTKTQESGSTVPTCEGIDR